MPRRSRRPSGSPRRRRTAPPRRGPRLARRTFLLGAGAALLLGAGIAVWLVWPFWRLAAQFGDRVVAQPSRLYARSTVLETGAPAAIDAVTAELVDLGYRRVSADRLTPGELRAGEGSLTVHLRAFPTPEGWLPPTLLEVGFAGRRVRSLRRGGEVVAAAALEPPLLASFYGPDMKERRPVTELDELPEELIQAVLAAEDDRFFRHQGLSASGIVRAAWVNLRGGGVRQGGSTLTQQLVKNLYLTHERTLVRKIRETVLAILLEVRYDKRDILGAYLNEIYWGSRGPVNVMGVGSAAWAYYGKEPTQLALGEAATLAGMIASPGDFSPLTHPEACRARRDWVLGRMAQLGWVDAERAARAASRPLELNPQKLVVRRAAYFVDAMEAEAAERFGLQALADAGYALLATLDWEDQKRAAEAVAWGLPALEEGWEKGNRAAGPLQAALVSLHPGSGAILAYVGGRSYSGSQFDRVSQALRQAGSAFKPVVFAAAFEHGVVLPSSLLEDSPLTISLAGRTWTPKNHDGSFRGWVTARTALEQSLNIPTARLALQLGLERVVALARAMGISSPLEPVPALALGAFEVTPRELATVYASLAAGGVRPPVHGLSAVLSPDGERLRGEALPPPQRILSAETAYLMNSVLQGVLDRGTGGGARTQGIHDALAGKTGTTNDRRDSWFVGYAPNRVSLVWVGYDDNARTRLSGSRAALPIWARFTRAVRPSGGYPSFPQPRGIATAVVDPATGMLATDACPEVLTEVFPVGRVPREICDLHRGWFADPLDQPAGVEVEGVHPIRRWLQRVFGRERDEDGP